MSRLIDADAVEERLIDFIAENEPVFTYAIEHKDRVMLDDTIEKFLYEQPTAFDVDKVVEQLTVLRDKAFGTHARNLMLSAIEIVKRGGIDD